MSHRSDAEGSLLNARQTLAEIQGQRTTTDITIANAARAQAIAAAAVAQALLAIDDTLRVRREEGVVVADLIRALNGRQT